MPPSGREVNLYAPFSGLHDFLRALRGHQAASFNLWSRLGLIGFGSNLVYKVRKISRWRCKTILELSQ